MSDKLVPIIPLQGMAVLPGMLMHLEIGRDIVKSAIREAMASDGTVFLTLQGNEELEIPEFEDLYETGVIAKVRQVVESNDDIVRIMVLTKERAKLVSLSRREPCLVGCIEDFEKDSSAFLIGSIEREAMCRNLKELYKVYLTENKRAGRSAADEIEDCWNLEDLIDKIGMHIRMECEKRQEILECVDVQKRYEILSVVLMEEIELFRIREGYLRKVKQEVDKNQKEYYLREQMKVIRDELGEGESQSSYVEKYKSKLDELECSEEVREKIAEEIRRLSSMPPASSETTVSRDYIENLLAIPWEKMSVDSRDLKQASEILEQDHYGLKKIKERIIEFLAVRMMTESCECPILCLVGPPGTGKTSIARSIARALNKEYVRICLGGVRDEAEIRGHRRTYVGAMPGRFIAALKKANVRNPLILLDEIDKVSSDYKGDTSAALLEVLDPEQNKNFVDHYVEMPVDMSKVFFVCTANSLEGVSRPLLDRMEIISLSGYTENERFHIGKEYIIPKQIEKNGLKKSQLSINDAGLKAIISYYTKEAGVRGLEKQINKICRKTARKILEDETTAVRINTRNITDFLGKKRYRIKEANEKDDVGIVRGLAWTQVGGDTLEIEVNTMPGTGKMVCTGKLGDVMKESAQISLSLVRSLLPKNEKFFKENDFHIHVPEGAVPKDGPSAGVTMTTALYSAVTGIKVKKNVAMTGEITLRGRVLAIGGLKEKMLAAKLAGITEVVVPKANKPDVEEFDEEITEGMKVYYAEKIQDVLKIALAKEKKQG